MTGPAVSPAGGTFFEALLQGGEAWEEQRKRRRGRPRKVRPEVTEATAEAQARTEEATREGREE